MYNSLSSSTASYCTILLLETPLPIRLDDEWSIMVLQKKKRGLDSEELRERLLP